LFKLQLKMSGVFFLRHTVDLAWCYRTVFGWAKIHSNETLEQSVSNTCGHRYKLVKMRCTINTRLWYCSQRVVNVWNSLPCDIVDFA